MPILPFRVVATLWFVLKTDTEWDRALVFSLCPPPSLLLTQAQITMELPLAALPSSQMALRRRGNKPARRSWTSEDKAARNGLGHQRLPNEDKGSRAILHNFLLPHKANLGEHVQPHASTTRRPATFKDSQAGNAKSEIQGQGSCIS